VTDSFNGNCDSTQPSQFNVAYSLDIQGEQRYYQTPVYSLACHFN